MSENLFLIIPKTKIQFVILKEILIDLIMAINIKNVQLLI